MTSGEIKERVMVQIGNDKDDLGDYEPFLDRYVNEGYDQLINAWADTHVATDEYPLLSMDDHAPLLPEWTHGAIADYATYLVYRNGNPQKQQRGAAFYAMFQDVVSRVRNEGGQKGARNVFVGIYP